MITKMTIKNNKFLLVLFIFSIVVLLNWNVKEVEVKGLKFPKNKKIVVFSTYPGAGLGNQLFYFASAYGLAKKYEASLWFLAKDEELDNQGNRKFLLDKFKINNKPLLDQIIFLKINDLASLRDDMLSNDDINVINEKNFFDQFKNNNKIFFIDYMNFFQSPIYFENVKNDLTKITLEAKVTNEKILENILKTNQSVAVHVRRGDFTSHKWSLPITYQKSAMDDMRKKLINPHFFIFSDDILFVSEEFKNLKDVTIASTVSDNITESTLSDLKLMINCKHLISSNSTFSWWGAYLINNPEKIIIVPDQILHHDNSYNYYLKTWIKKEVKSD